MNPPTHTHTKTKNTNKLIQNTISPITALHCHSTGTSEAKFTLWPYLALARPLHLDQPALFLSPHYSQAVDSACWSSGRENATQGEQRYLTCITIYIQRILVINNFFS